MRRLLYIAALALMTMVVLAPGAMAQQMNYQQMNHQHMMPNGQMMDDNMMASPSASASAYPSATASTSASASPSAATTPSAPRSNHHGVGGSSASAAVGGRLPSTGGVSLVSSL